MIRGDGRLGPGTTEKYTVEDVEWLNNNFPDRLKLFPLHDPKSIVNGSLFEWDYARDGHHFGPDTVRRIGYKFSQFI